MSVSTKYQLAATVLLLVAWTNDARAQIDLPFGPANYDHNFQLFAPLDIDLNGLPDQNTYGYFFNYDKLWWNYSAEHTTVGDPNVFVESEKIYVFNDDIPGINGTLSDQGTIPAPYQIHNGITYSPPNAAFMFGDRYEVGYEDGAYGWTIGVLDGPKSIQTQSYGFGYGPPLDPDYVENAFDFPGVGEGTRAFGFGSVHINFATPAGYLKGFRDYLNYLAGATIGTQVGPIAYVGNYGAVSEDLGDDEDVDIQFIRLTDDIDEDGIPGAIVVVTVGPDGQPLLTTLTDFDDLHEFNIAFDTVTIRTLTEVDGVEAMWSQELTNQRYMAKNQNNRLTLSYGARFMQLDDEFRFDADGGILGYTFSDTKFTNQIVGPQVGLKWVNQRSRWVLTADARALLGYNRSDWRQTNGIGQELIPGATNRLLYAQPTYSAHGITFNDFSPVAELRVEMAYRVTQSIALTAGYTGSFIGNIYRAAPSVAYRLPDMGYRDGGTQDMLVNGFNFGVEVHH